MFLVEDDLHSLWLGLGGLRSLRLRLYREAQRRQGRGAAGGSPRERAPAVCVPLAQALHSGAYGEKCPPS